jgi:exodeoxyribonuclease V alpha subunit
MAELKVPPPEGVLARPAAGPPRAWQRALRDLSLPEGLLALAWSLSGVVPGLEPTRRRDLALLLLAVLVNEAQGSTCLALDDAEAAARLAQPFGAPGLPLELLEDSTLSAMASPESSGPLVVSEGRLSSRRLFEAERSLAQGIQRLASLPSGEITVPESILTDPVVLSEEQGAAVSAAVSGHVALITGGPGTGKTSIIVAILRAALSQGMRPGELALAAPTGKAAHRMAGAIHGARARIQDPTPSDEGLLDPALLPQTLHRLLGYLPSGGRFRHHAGNPLKARLVLVDEASMIDVVMMDRLLQALHPEARFVLLGDADQLPSVEAGTAFRDLVAGLPGCTVRLTRSYRMDEATSGGAALLEAARRIKDGRGDAVFNGSHALVVRTGLEQIQGHGVELFDPDEPAMRAFLDAWMRSLETQEGYLSDIQHVFRLESSGWVDGEAGRLERLFRHMDRTRLLCPTREAPRLKGSEGINAYLHAQVQASRDQGLQKRLAFSLGEPVIMTRNDYARGIFNGDQGLMLLVSSGDGEPRLEVVFPTREGFQAFAAGPLLGELELAYALTVHKAQGSEFDRVGLVLPEGDSPLSTREVLYTALTRARTAVTILGSREAVERAAERTIKRTSRLAAAFD